MIDYKTLAADYETKLNAELADYEFKGKTLEELFPHDRFRFKVNLTSGDFTQSTRADNIVTHYINAIYIVTNSAQDGLTSDTESGIIDVGVEYLVPYVEFNELDESGNIIDTYNIGKIISDIIASACSKHTYEQSNGRYIGIQYTLPTAGTREEIEGVGDCLTLDNQIRYIYLVNGNGSTDYELWMGDERIWFNSISFARKTVSESAIGSLEDASKIIPQTTAFSIHATCPSRLTYFEKAKSDYLFKGIINEITVTVKYPEILALPQSTHRTTITKTYKMVFDNASLSGELTLGANTEFTLVEKLTLKAGE